MSAIQQHTTTANRARVEAAIAAWNRGQLDDYLTLYDDSILLHGYAPKAMTKSEVAGFYRMIFSALAAADGSAPPLAIDILMETADMIAMRFTMSGARVGPFLGFAPNGMAYETGGLTVLRFASGRVVERWSSVDMLGLLIQTGAVVPPTA